MRGIILHGLIKNVEIYATFPLEKITGIAVIISSQFSDGERWVIIGRHQAVKR